MPGVPRSQFSDRKTRRRALQRDPRPELQYVRSRQVCGIRTTLLLRAIEGLFLFVSPSFFSVSPPLPPSLRSRSNLGVLNSDPNEIGPSESERAKGPFLLIFALSKTDVLAASISSADACGSYCLPADRRKPESNPPKRGPS